jgi:hypothetical protein
VGTAEADGSDQIVLTVARILNDSGLSPVVVDAESAERRLSMDFGLADRAGLTDLLRTGGKVENLLHVDGEITILGYGRGVLDPHVSHRLGPLLKRLHQQHHVAVVHVDPRLTANALVVAQAADAVFIAVRRGAVRSSTLRYVVEVMRVAGVRVEGAILHEMKPGSSDSRSLETAAEPTPAGETLNSKEELAEPTPPMPEVSLDGHGQTDEYSVIVQERGRAAGEYGPALDRSGSGEPRHREPATSTRPPGVDSDPLGPPSMTSGGG